MAEQNPPAQEHASKPGLITYVVLAVLLAVYVFAVYGDSMKRFLGLE